MKKEYNAAARKRTNLLKYDKDRSKARRNNLKSDIAAGKRCALEKASRLKIAKRLSYAKRRKNGRVKALKAQRRAVVKFIFIKSEFLPIHVSFCLEYKTMYIECKTFPFVHGLVVVKFLLIHCKKIVDTRPINVRIFNKAFHYRKNNIVL